MTCAGCGSDDTRSLAVMYQTGVSITPRGYVHGTVAGLRAAPPRKQRLGWPIAILVVMLFVLAIFSAPAEHSKPDALMIVRLLTGVAALAVVVTAFQNRFIWRPLRSRSGNDASSVFGAVALRKARHDRYARSDGRHRQRSRLRAQGLP